jgi:hypothetical protein
MSREKVSIKIKVQWKNAIKEDGNQSQLVTSVGFFKQKMAQFTRK